MAVRAEFVRQVVCREAPGEDEVGVRCRRHRGTISAVRRPTRWAPTRRNWCCTCRRRRTAGTLNAAGGVLVHQCGEAVRVVICACRAGAWGFVWHRTFSLSRAQSRTCSGCAEARKGARMCTFSLSRAQSRTCSGYAGAGKRRMKFNDSPLPQTVATGVRLGVASEFRRREEPSGLRICAWPGRGTKCSSTSVRRRAARFPYGSSWPSMRRRLRSRRNSTSAGPSSLRRALSDGC